MIKRLLLLIVSLFVVLGSPASAAKIPWPEWHRSEYDWKYPEEYEMYKTPAVIVRGDPQIHPSTHGFIHAPRAVNALINYQYQTGQITREEWARIESDTRHDWIYWFTLQFTLYSEDPYWATTGGPYTGPIIQTVTIETANGHKIEQDDLDFTLPEYIPEEGLFRNIIPLAYPREVIDTRPEWIKLTVSGEDFEYYFFWEFDV